MVTAIAGCDRLFARHERQALEADEALRRHCSTIKAGDRVQETVPFHWTRTELGWDVTGDGYSRCILELDGDRVKSAGWLPD
ncbi:MAG: hypothetical protein ACXVEF_08660 [Polyangiales bacterium]